MWGPVPLPSPLNTRVMHFQMHSGLLILFSVVSILLRWVKEKLGCLDMQRRESSEDVNKEAGEMDEGSGQQHERDKDGWSEAPAERQRKTEGQREGGMHGGDL